MNLLRSLDALGVKIRRLVDASGDDLVASLRDVREVLLGYADIGDRLAPTLENMLRLADIAEFATRGENLAGYGYFEVGPGIVSLDGLLDPTNSPLEEEATR